MEAVDALRRIAVLLERSGAPAYRVTAFRRAAETLAALPPGELERLAGAGSLRSLRGIGEATEAVVLQALAGEVPRYWRGFRRSRPRPSPRPGTRCGRR